MDRRDGSVAYLEPWRARSGVEMVKRAVLIGSPTDGLAGCVNDVALMDEVLTARGFACTPVVPPFSTRQGILDALEALTAEAGTDDAVVVFYSGHGGRIPYNDWEDRQDRGRPSHAQFIVPLDIDESTTEDFRGLLAEELTLVQRRLTDRTRNVTMILDCCHSGYMARGRELIPKAISRGFAIAGAAARLAELPSAVRRGADTNADVVRVVACQPEQSAFERAEGSRGEPQGALTEALAAVLGDLGDERLSWYRVGELVRRRVEATAPQRASIEGPSGREVFSLAERRNPNALPVRITAGTGGVPGVGGREGGAFIEAAQVLGVAAGDTFELRSPDGGRRVGTAEVAGVEGSRAMLDVLLAKGGQLPDPCDAIPMATRLPRPAIHVEGNGARATALVAALDASAHLRRSSGGEPVLATVRVTGGREGGVTVVDGAGAALRDHAFPDTDGGRRDVVRLLEVLARGERLKALPSGTGRARLSAKVSVELASHEDGKRIRRRRHGERLFSDEVISLRIRNQSPSELFVWLFDVGVTGDITLITNQSPSGWRLGPKGTTDDTYTAGGEAGTALEWRPDVPRDGPRPEAFVLVVADRRQDLGALETPKGLRGTRSGLDQALEEVRSGTREWGAATGAVDGALRYAVERVDFLLEAVPKPRIDEPAFEVDDTPDLSLRALQPRGAVEPPKAVAVRLAELAVRRNGALFSASIRVDSLVLTADKDGQVLANPTTMRFPNVADHDVLPLDNALLFHGDVNGFLDLALWVWRDDAKGRDLADLFATELGQQGTRDALRFVGGLVLAAPQVAVGVAAVSAVAGIVRMGAHLVAAATKREIGVYRTSKLAFESFGVGRMPPAGRKQAKDIEFAYEITEL